jgi:hypothetical protein
MSVNPSPIGGFAGQFFDNNGQPLSGGKIYTYAAGTTTPQATYTSALGGTPHANPIVLDSAGRVPGGEIWLTDSLIYKFVIETSTAILIGTYDNITGVNSNFVNYTVQEEVITATAGQTVFNLSTINYTPGTNSLSVYIDGVNQYVGDSYLETDSDTVTFTSGLHVGAEVKFTTAVQTTTGAVDASDVGYTAGFTGATAQTVQTKLEQYVSVKDFGAVGDGVADDGPAINAVISALNAAGGGTLWFPEGVYNIDTALVLLSNVHLNIGAKAVLDVATLSGGIAMQAQGTVGTAVPLASNASRTNTSVAVAAGAEAAFTAGDYVLIYSERQPDPAAQKDGEFQIVKSTSSGSITLQDGLWSDYATADTASIRKLNPVSNIRVFGGGTIRGSGTNDKLLTFYRCNDVHVDSIIFEDGDFEALTFQSTLNFSATNCSFYRSNNAGTGYGVAIYDGSQWGDVIGNKFIDCRHGVSGGGNTGGYGLNRFVNIIGNNAYGGLDSAYDGHSPCQYWNFVGNTATAKNGTNSDGITWQGLDVVIADNTLIGCKNYGVFLEPRRPENQTGLTVKGNVIRDSGLFGVYLLPVGTVGTISGVNITGNTVLNAANHGILARSNTANRDINGLNISDNTVISSTGRGVYVLSEAATISAVDISGNTIYGSSAEGIYVYANTADINNCGVRDNSITMTAATDAIGVQTGATGNFAQLTITGNVGGGGTHGVRKFTGVGTYTNVWVADNALTGSTARIRGFSEAEFGENQGYILFASATYDPPSLNDGAGAETDVTVTGAALGDYVDQISFSLDTQGINLDGQVTALNTVTVRFQNETGGTIDLGSGTIRIRVRKVPNP